MTAALLTLLADDSYRVRWAAAAALAGRDGNQVTAALLTLLTDREWLVREAATQALAGRDGDQVTAALLTLLTPRTGDRTVGHSTVAHALAGRDGDQVTAALLALLTDDSYLTREWAALGLAGRDGDQVTAALLALLADHDEGVRRTAAGALADREGEEVTVGLLTLLTDRMDSVRRAAARALARRDGDQVTAALLTLLTDYRQDVREAAATALGEREGDLVAAGLLTLLTHDRKVVREAAATTLSAGSQPQSLPVVARGLSDMPEAPLEALQPAVILTARHYGRSTLKWPRCSLLIGLHRGVARGWWFSSDLAPPCRCGWRHAGRVTGHLRRWADRGLCQVFVLVRWGGMERRVELFAAIRFDWQRHRMPIRALARKYDVHRRTVRQAIASPVPPDRKVPVRAAPVRAAVAGWIDEMLREDLAAPRKQRHTARRVFERLADEHGAQVSYSYVAKYVARRRAEITAQDGDGAEGLAGFVPQVREPGAEAEVDFGDVTVELDGLLPLLPVRVPAVVLGQGLPPGVCQPGAGGVPGRSRGRVRGAAGPARQIRYDNLSPAVAKVLAGRNRTETARWLSFRAFYGFEAFYCLPGAEGAHEKGGIEGEIGRFPPLVRAGAAGGVAGGAERPAR